MMTLLRKHRSWLMIVIAVLAIPFVFYFNKTDLSAQRKGTFATIYGRDVTMVEAQRNARFLALAENLGMDTLAQTLGGGAQDPNKAAAYFALNLIVLQHEIDRLGIQATQSDLAEYIKNLRGFRGPNGFDPKKYQEFVENVMPAYGFGSSEIEELAGYGIGLNRIKDMVTVGFMIPESASKADFDQAYGNLIVQAVRVHGADFSKDLKITDDDIQKYFEAHKAEQKTEEKRKIAFVRLSLTDEQKKLTGKERVDALQKLDDKSVEFTQALAEKGANFEQVAAKLQVPVKTTGDFTAASPDPQLKDAPPQVAATAFQLTEQEPNSDPIENPDGYYILHLAGVTASRPLSLEEAKGKIVEAIKTTKTREMSAAKGREVSQAVRDALKAGTPIAGALDKAKVKAEKIAPFALIEGMDPSVPDKEKDRPKDFVMIKNAASQVQPGEVSQFFPTDDGGLFVYVEKREPPDEARYKNDKPAFDERILKNKRSMVFEEWLHDRQQEAGLLSSAPQPGNAPPKAVPAPPVRKS